MLACSLSPPSSLFHKSSAVAFLVLHELTAFPPLLALFAVFQYSNLSIGKSIVDYCKSSEGRLGSWITDSEEYIARVGKRKGWFGYEKSDGQVENVVERVGDKAAETTANAVAAYLFIKVCKVSSSLSRSTDCRYLDALGMCDTARHSFSHAACSRSG